MKGLVVGAEILQATRFNKNSSNNKERPNLLICFIMNSLNNGLQKCVLDYFKN